MKDLLNTIREIFNNEIDIEYTEEAQEGHYQITPYSFRPRVARKLVANYYHDLGQGLLDVIQEVYANTKQNGKTMEIIRSTIDLDCNQ